MVSCRSCFTRPWAMLSRPSENTNEAESALHSAIGLSELELATVTDEASRLKWSQRTSSTYRNFAQIHLRRGDAQGALEIWEAYRGAAQRDSESSDHGMAEPHEVATRLQDLTRETVVSYALLPDGMATWVYDDRGVFAHWADDEPNGYRGIMPNIFAVFVPIHPRM